MLCCVNPINGMFFSSVCVKSYAYSCLINQSMLKSTFKGLGVVQIQALTSSYSY